MKITYTVWQGSLNKGRLTASKMSEVIDTIKELNTLGDKLKFEALVHTVEESN
jgi:hypothetical protein